MAESADTPTIAAVTFGRSSFVGRSLVVALLSNGRFAVRVVDPLPAPDPAPFLSPFFQSGRISYHQVDIRHRSASLSAAFAGAAVVFHVDPTATSLQSQPAPSSDFHRLHLILAQSTRNVIVVCRECGVERLVYVGSADVVVGEANEVCCWDETVTYPERCVDRLIELRAQAEAMVLRANRKDGLSTCALRASNPFGPGDDILLSSLVQGAKEGWSKFIIGSGENLWDFTYIENVAHASICAEQALRLRTPYVAGRPFFITNKESIKFWDFLANLLEGLGYQRPSIHLPAKIVLALAEVAKFIQEKFLSSKTTNPFVSPSRLRSFTGTRTFDCSNAERIIGYSPIVSMEDGLTLTIASFPQLANGAPYIEHQDLVEPSKAEKLLGSGRVAEVLLWRDDRKTFTCLLALFMLHYWFFMSERTFISSAAKLLLLFALILFFHGTLPFSMLGFSIERVPLSSFEVPEFILRNFFDNIASLWNLGIRVLDTVAQGKDWGVLFKVTGIVYLTKLLLLFSFSLLSAAGLVFLFTFFIVYEQCEGEIEKLIPYGALGLDKLKGLLIVKLPSSMVKYVF